MKITSFNPQIITKNSEQLVKLFEELGFERRHKKENVGEKDVTGISMKNADGFHVDISEPKMELPQDMTSLRMNVRDFDEAYEMLTARGFKNFYGENTVLTPSSRSAIMISPTGFVINLVEHIKKHD